MSTANEPGRELSAAPPRRALVHRLIALVALALLVAYLWVFSRTALPNAPEVDGEKPTRAEIAAYLLQSEFGIESPVEQITLVVLVVLALTAGFAIAPLDLRRYPRLRSARRLTARVVGGLGLALLIFWLAQHRWADLADRALVVGVAALVILGAFSSGSLALRALGLRETLTRLEHAAFAGGLGFALLSLFTLGIGVLGSMNQLLAIGVPAAATIVAALWWLSERLVLAPPGEGSDHRELAREIDEPYRATRRWLWLAVPFVVVSYLGALLPPTDFDVLEYHLQGPKEFYQAGRVSFLSHNVYTSMPFGTEMLSLLSMIVMDDWWHGALAGKFVLATLAPLTALALLAAGRRFFSVRAGVFAALIYLTTPWVYRLSIIAYVEGAYCFYLFASLFAVALGLRNSGVRIQDFAPYEGTRQSAPPYEAARQSAPPYQGGAGGGSAAITARPSTAHARITERLALLAGLLAGAAVACKYPAMILVAVPLGLATLVGAWVRGRRRLGPVRAASTEPAQPRPPIPDPPRPIRFFLAYVLGGVLTLGPWLLKNAAETRNPFYPMLYGLFDGRDLNPTLNERCVAAHMPLFSPSGPHDWLSGERLSQNFTDVTVRADWLSPLLFGLAPMAFLFSGRRTFVALLAAYALFIFFAWWVLTNRVDRFWVPMIPVVALLAGAAVTWSDTRLWRVGVSVVTCAVIVFNFGFVTTALCGNNAYFMTYERARSVVPVPAIRLLNELHARTERPMLVLSVGDAAVFHLEPPVLYNTVFDHNLFLRMAGYPDAHTPANQWTETLRAGLQAAGVTHVYVSWSEIARYRAPGSYGYPDFIVPERFDELVFRGVLVPLAADPGRYTIYEVASPPARFARAAAGRR